jgi:signal transduction histidine kinase
MTRFEHYPPCASFDGGLGLGDGDSTQASSDDAPGRRSARATPRITVLGEMTAGLAHDFRNILAVIESGLRVAERCHGDAKASQAALAAAHEGVRRGMRLTSQLVSFARPEKPDVHPENVNDLLDGLKSFLKYGAGPNNRLVLELAPNLPPCRIDPPLFNAAILNLVVNARDAMPRGGEIRITSSLISLSETDDVIDDPFCVLIRIIDQGAGMAEEVRDRIYDTYFTTKGETGTGLGIPQVASFMRSSGGCLNVNSEPGAGTSFDLYFPVCDSPGLIGTNLWRRLARGTNEDRRSDPVERSSNPGYAIEGPAVQSSHSPSAFFASRSPDRLRDVAWSGTNPSARDQ